MKVYISIYMHTQVEGYFALFYIMTEVVNLDTTWSIR